MRSAPRPESGDDLAHLGLGGVAALGREGVLGLGEPGDRSLGGMLLHGDPQLLEPESGLVEAPPRQDVGQTGAGGAVLAGPGVLAQEAEPSLPDHGAGGRGHLAAEHLEQAGLARAVATHQAHLVAGAHQQAASSRVRRPPTSTLSWRASSTVP